MRSHLPLWPWALRQGAWVTVVCLVTALGTGGLTRDRVLLALGVGAVLGPLLGLLARADARRTRADLLLAVPELRALDPARQATAERAARRGPVPADDAVRLVAAEVARFRLARSVATRTTGIAFGLVFTVMQLALAVFVPWAWFLVAVFAGMTAYSALAPRLRSRRVVTLEDGPVAAASTAG